MATTSTVRLSQSTAPKFEIEEISPGNYLAVNGYLNQIIATVPDGSCIHLNPLPPGETWKFGPPGNYNQQLDGFEEIIDVKSYNEFVLKNLFSINETFHLLHKNITINGNNSIISIDNYNGIIINSATLTLENIKILFNASQELIDSINFGSLFDILNKSKLLIGNNVSLECIASLANGQFLNINFSEIIVKPGGYLHVNSTSNNPSHMLSVNNSKLTNDGSIHLGPLLNTDGTVTIQGDLNKIFPTFEYTTDYFDDGIENLPVIPDNNTIINSIGNFYVVGFIYFTNMLYSIHRFTDLQINTGSLLNASAIYCAYEDDMDVIIFDYGLFITRLGLHRNKNSKSNKPAIIAYNKINVANKDLQSLSDISQSDYVNSLPPLNSYDVIFIANNYQTGYNDAEDEDPVYSALSLQSNGIDPVKGINTPDLVRTVRAEPLSAA